MAVFVAEAKELAQAVDYAAKVIGKSAQPIHTAVRVAADSAGVLTFTGFDPAAVTSASATVAAEVKESAEFLVPGALLASVMSKLAGQVTVTLEDTSVAVAGGSSRLTLPVMPLEDAPRGLPDADSQVATLELEVLQELVSQVAFAAAADATVDEKLSAVAIEMSEKAVTMVATDRYRLATRTVEWDGKLDDEVTLLIPAKQLSDTVRGMRASDGQVTVGLAGTQLVLTTDQRVAKIGSVDAEFVPWRRLLPAEQDLTAHATFNASDAKEAFGRLSTVLMPGDAFDVDLGPDEVVFTAASSASAQAGVDRVAARFSGEEQTFRLNPRLLLDGLNVLGDVDAKVSLVAPSKPFVVTSEQVSGFTLLVMPLLR